VNCRELTAFLMDYLEGELAQSERSDFEFHLHGCQDCVRYLETYQRTIELGRAACAEDHAVPEDVPEGLVRAILAARRSV
jgi:anti-sigma factor RsiW